jgi:hypothetical protein
MALELKEVRCSRVSMGTSEDTFGGRRSGDRRSAVALLFAVEMWERFSFYGMRSFLVLFLTAPLALGGFGWAEGPASRLFGWYTGLVYLTPLVGGLLADRALGTHAAILVGGATIALGHLCLATPLREAFFIGLALVIIGTGFHKPNISTMAGQLFDEGDQRRDGAFTFFYMGISAGAMLGPSPSSSRREAAEPVRGGDSAIRDEVAPDDDDDFAHGASFLTTSSLALVTADIALGQPT